jgi:uncharacterized protein DUF2726
MTVGFIDFWFLVLVVALLALLLWRIFPGWFGKTGRSRPFILPLGMTLRPEPLLTDRELLLYNLIRLAVQDRYLLFAQVPLWSFLSVEPGVDYRAQVLRHLALKRADFILVHPGSRMVEQVVQVEEDSSADPKDESKGREVQRAVQAAGIRVTTLKAQPTYTVQQLEQLLGVSDPE